MVQRPRYVRTSKSLILKLVTSLSQVCYYSAQHHIHFQDRVILARTRLLYKERKKFSDNHSSILLISNEPELNHTAFLKHKAS